MWVIPVILIVISLLMIGFVIIRSIPRLRVIDVNSITKERERKVKEQLILSKLNRTGGAKLRTVGRLVQGAAVGVSKQGRRAVQRLYKLEQYYQKLRRNAIEGVHAYDAEMLKKRLAEASEFLKEDEFIPAEKIYIDIISHNPKNVDAYEALGNMYIQAGQLEQARETWSFALLLAPNDASVNVSLAELAMGEEKYKKALEYLRSAIEKRAKNPKYLDFYIEAALKGGSLKDARKGISALKSVNPDNAKIEEFEKRFGEMKEKYIKKSHE